MASRMKSVNRLRILVLGYIVRGPLGGLAWQGLAEGELPSGVILLTD